MTAPLVPGPLKMYRLAELAEGDGTMQVAYGIDPETLEHAVFVRFGSVVSVISIEGAEALGRSLARETTLARHARSGEAISGLHARDAMARGKGW